MATGLDEQYARHLYNQSLESEILRGISEFPMEGIRDDPDALLAWQLQNQECKGMKEKNSIPLHQLKTRSFSADQKSKHTCQRKEKNEVNEVKQGHLLIIDSDTEDDTMNVSFQDTAKCSDDTDSNSGQSLDKNFKIQVKKENIGNSSNSGVLKPRALPTQLKDEKRENVRPMPLNVYSDGLDEDCVPQATEDSDFPETHRRFPLVVNEHGHQRNVDQKPEHNGPVNEWPRNKRFNKGKCLIQYALPSDPEEGMQTNSHRENLELRSGNSRNNDKETQHKHSFPDSSISLTKQVEKNFRPAKNLKRSEIDNDESVACQLQHQLNKTQVRRDKEYAQRLQALEKNNIAQAEGNIPERLRIRRDSPYLQLHDPFAHRVIRHRTPIPVHGAHGLMESILGMEREMLPPHLMQGHEVDMNDYEALWELAERIGEAKGKGLSEKELQSLSVSPFDVGNVDNKNDNDCRICITDFADGEMITTLPCKHIFHKECIETWLKRKAVCPICRHGIDIKEES